MPKTKTRTNKSLYWSLIATFALLYLAVAFVSTLHAITFFQITNTLWLAILLGGAYEVGQATVLFSIIMTENKNKILAWLMMFLLTSLQVTANVYASYMYMTEQGGSNWEYWQKSILFWVDASSPEMYRIIISWISGALLPLVALGMTALIADNVQYTRNVEEGDEDDKEEKEKDEFIEETDNFDQAIKGISNIFKKKDKKGEVKEEDKEDVNKEKEEYNPISHIRSENGLLNTPSTDIEQEAKDIADSMIRTQPIQTDSSKYAEQTYTEDTLDSSNKKNSNDSDIPKKETIKNEEKIEPVNKQRGWHLKKKYVDDDGNIFNKGKYIGKIDNDENKHPPESKKVNG